MKLGDGVATTTKESGEWKTAQAAALRLQEEVAKAKLRESEDRFSTLFTAMEQGFCLIEKVPTDPGAPTDFRYLAANPAFERHTGLVEVIGKTIRQLVPSAEASIMERYDRVVETGESDRFESYVAALDLWMDAEVFRAHDPSQVAVLFSNVSDRKRAQETLRESGKRKEFLLALSDGLRVLDEPAYITGTATRMLGEWLVAQHAYYVDWPEGERYGEVVSDYAEDGLPSLAGRYPNDAFGSTYDRISKVRPGSWRTRRLVRK